MKTGAADLNRIAMEIIRKTPEEFCEETGIDLSAMGAVIEAATMSVFQAMERGETDLNAMLADVVGQTFFLGWHTRDQYGKPKS